MQFINIVVHSTEDIALRVFLQQEFTNLKLDEYLKVGTRNAPPPHITNHSDYGRAVGWGHLRTIRQGDV